MQYCATIGMLVYFGLDTFGFDKSGFDVKVVMEHTCNNYHNYIYHDYGIQKGDLRSFVKKMGWTSTAWTRISSKAPETFAQYYTY